MADFLGMMKQAAAAASPRCRRCRPSSTAIEVEGIAGGGLVTVKLTGKGDLKGVKIDDSLLKPTRRKSSRTCWSPPMPTRAARPRR